MGDRLGTPGAVDFFRSAFLFSTKNVTRKLFVKSTEVYITHNLSIMEVYITHNLSIMELFLEETPILALSIAVFD